MNKLYLLFFTLICLAVVQPIIFAQSPVPKLVISEIQTESEISASAEYIEIYNPGFISISLENIKVQYLSASGSSWTNKATLTGSLAGMDHFLLVTEASNLSGNQIFNSGLAGGGGHVRIVLVGETELELDKVGWGTALNPETQSVTAPVAGESIKRMFNEDGEVIDSGNNFADFLVSSTPYPQATFMPVAEEEPAPVDVPVTPDPVEEPDPIDPEPVEPTPEPIEEDLPEAPLDDTPAIEYLKLSITELFIDPAAPLTDADDEFVEIYNPNSESVNFSGYRLEVGENFTRGLELPSYNLAPGEYLAVFSIDTSLALANKGGQARLLDPDMKEIFRTNSYTKAPTDESWAHIYGAWQWTEKVTPHKANLAGALPTTTNSLTKRAPTSSSTSKVLSGALAESSETVESTELDKTLPKTNSAVLVWLGLFALLYGSYEYRSETRNTFQIARRNFENWRVNWRATQGGRSYRIGRRYRDWQNGLSKRIGRWRRKLG